jgi:plasmid stabilization system protein ParE
MGTYRLTKSAEADLRSISRYTKNQWGKAQAVRYTDQLLRGLEKIASGTGRFKDLSKVSPGLRTARCEHHYLVCIFRPGHESIVIGVLHERMDLMVRIAERLQ